MKLDLEMDLNLDEPAFPGAATFVAVVTSSRRGLLSPTMPTTQHKALNSLLPHFLPKKGQVLQMARFARIEDEAEIRACWEGGGAGRPDTRVERQYREAVKSWRN